MQRPTTSRPVLAALLLAALAALITVVSGPSAAAVDDDHSSDPTASVQGLGPHGDAATLRSGSAPTMSGAVAVADLPPRIEPLAAPSLVGTATEPPQRTTPKPAATLQLSRAPPAGPAR